MPRKCTICGHSRREEIDQAIVSGRPLLQIAKEFGVSEPALRRHAKNHVPRTLVKAHEAEEVSRADDLLARAKAYEAKAVALLKKAEGSGDYGTALRGIREARACLELLAKLRGEIEQEKVTVNILQSQEWIELKTMILTALDPYPKAKKALYKALRDGDEGRRY